MNGCLWTDSIRITALFWNELEGRSQIYLAVWILLVESVFGVDDCLRVAGLFKSISCA
jgi:hypothetical protein